MSSPNKMKFASQVSGLYPTADDYTEQVVALQEAYNRRKMLISGLVSALTSGGDTEDKIYDLLGDAPEKANKLDDAIRAAVERFVVDEY